MTLLFVSVKRTGCFAVSALQPPGPPSKNGAKVVQATFNYRLGVRPVLGTYVSDSNYIRIVFFSDDHCTMSSGPLLSATTSAETNLY